MNFRNRKRARAAFRCTALIAVITAVNASNSERSDSTRRARTIITFSFFLVYIMVILLAVNIRFRGHYACNRLYGSSLGTHCACV